MSILLVLISNPTGLSDAICEFGRINVFALVDRWFGVSEAEGLSTIWKEQTVVAETLDVHGSGLPRLDSTLVQLLYENLKVFHFC